MPTDDTTPTQRKADARWPIECLDDCDCGHCEQKAKWLDAYARACIAEAVAPALAYLDAFIAQAGTMTIEPYGEKLRHEHVRKLLIERAGT